jgi:AcrR family transcriptional regulator
VDRIAAEAASNKAQIYHYFGSKDGLFDAVFNQILVLMVEEAPIDATDLPEYAGRLFDEYEKHPEVQRLATWYRLERADAKSPLERIVTSNRTKIEAIAKAQEAGQLPTKYEPIVLLGLVLQLSSLWAGMTPEYALLVDRTSPAERRKVVTDAVAALIKE